MSKTGNISVNTNDIFPIIKKWLYSEHDIFIRELISNATDAITKRSTLARTKNQEIPEGKIEVQVSNDKKTMKITDNGLGMTEDEVEKYIAQLAFSGAEEFVNKMKKAGDEGADIIGKFGLGFYSSFMVADKVEIDSLSMEEGAVATKWTCEGDTKYEFSSSDKSEVGTTITLHINKEGEEFLSEWKLGDIIKQYCAFMPYAISILDTDKKPEKPKKEDGTEDTDAPAVAPTPRLLNNTTPLWKKDPTTLKDEDYKNFYRELYPMDQEPLFWLHLKVDHPFTLEGILYFPKVNPKMPFNDKNIKLYSKQVFVSDSVKNIIPEFLGLLKGVIDSTDIPLNVSRSSLQGDPNVKRITNYVVKKVAESLKKLFKNDRTKYEGIWEDAGIFVKYGCVSDPKFDEIMRKMVIFKDADGKFITLPEYKEKIPETYKEKLKDKVLYFEKNKSDITLRSHLQKEGVPTIETDDHIDPHFMQAVETKKQDDLTCQFASLDSEVHNLTQEENVSEDDMKIKDFFTKFLVGEKTEEEKKALDAMEVEITHLKNSGSPAYFKTDEQMKRFAQMTQSMGQNAAFPVKKTLVINPDNPLIQNAFKIHEKGNNGELVEKLCHHVQDLATISSEGLKDENKEIFVKRSQELISELTDLAT